MWIAFGQDMRRIGKWLFVARLVVLLALSTEARAADIVPYQPSPGAFPADAGYPFATYTPIGPVPPPPPAPAATPEALPLRPPLPPLKLVEPSEEAPRYRWYGYQILISDVVTSALVIGAARENSANALYLAAATWLLVPPIIHGLNGQYGAMGISFLGRLLLPSLAGFAGVAIGKSNCTPNGDNMDCAIAEVGLGALAVALAAIAVSSIDIGHYAWESITSPSPIAVAVLPTQHGATLALGATF